MIEDISEAIGRVRKKTGWRSEQLFLHMGDSIIEIVIRRINDGGSRKDSANA